MDGISVRLHNDNMNWWLKLPTTYETLQNALTEMGATNGNFTIDKCRADFGGRLDAVICGGDLAAVNYLAARLEELSNDQLKKLEALLESPFRNMILENITRTIDFTYNTGVCELITDARNTESLARHFIFKSDKIQMPSEWAKGINLNDFGSNLEQLMPGYYTFFGYLMTTGEEWMPVFEKTGKIPPDYQILPESSDKGKEGQAAGREKENAAPIEVFIQNQEQREKGDGEGVYLYLPTDADTLRGLLDSIGISESGNKHFVVFDVYSPYECINQRLTTSDNLDELNMLASFMSDMEDFEISKMQAILTSGVTDIGGTPSALINLLFTDNFDAFDTIDAKNAEELGLYWKDEKPVEISFEEYGKDIIADEKGVFTQWGYVYFSYEKLLP